MKDSHKVALADQDPSLANGTLILLSMIQLIGVYVSDLLTFESIGIKLGDKTDSGLCGMSETFSCKAAAASVYSEIGSLPISVIGEAYYLCALLMILIARLIPTFRSRLLMTLGVTASLSALYSLFLGTVSLLDLGFLCPLCIGLYLVNFSSLGLLALGRVIKPRSWPQLLKTPAPWIALGLMCATLIGSQAIYAARYKAEYLVAKKKIEHSQKVVFHEISLGDSPVRGDSSAALIVEFSDFQCPFCKRFTQYLKTAYEESLTERPFSYAFKHFPLSTQCNPHVKRDMHPRACHAAIASICAEEQGQFWPMHDLLFAQQPQLEDEDLRAYAEKLGMKIDTFIECLNSERARQRLINDIKVGAEAGVRGTPAFFVNGWGFKGAKRPKAIKEAVGKYAYGIEPAKEDNMKEGENPLKGVEHE